MKDMSGMKTPNQPSQPAKPQPGAHDMSAMSGDAMGGMKESMGAQPKLSTLNLIIVSVLSMAMLAGGLALAARYGDLSMRAGQGSMKRMNMPVESSRHFQYHREHGATDNKAAQDDMNGMTMPQR